MSLLGSTFGLHQNMSITQPHASTYRLYYETIRSYMWNIKIKQTQIIHYF